jgi:hypothetical protein
MFPRLKIKHKSGHFDTTEVIEAESQALLNIFAEHNFQDTLKNGRNAWKSAYARKGSTRRIMVTSRPKDGF